ncbi:hypothetical protein SteCoe_11683 [Stentor coeruleus]|uniref:Uncharacterized protein n=1 Tax=Stentor coeruleus TaxID=5963 RepID=A0A1R2CCL5_9CILI|nr:hypothetical protein SteCoe_11683 [Stentor coeruleus]
MSRTSIKTNKTVTEFRKFSLNNISETISSAFNNPIQETKTEPSNSRRSKILSSLKARNSEKDFFLTEAQINEIDIQDQTPDPDPLSYEQMIQEIEDISSGFKNREDDLAELRRRIKKCQIGIEAREVHYQGLHKSANEIDSQSTALMQKFKSMSSLPKYPGRK